MRDKELTEFQTTAWFPDPWEAEERSNFKTVLYLFNCTACILTMSTDFSILPVHNKGCNITPRTSIGNISSNNGLIQPFPRSVYAEIDENGRNEVPMDVRGVMLGRVQLISWSAEPSEVSPPRISVSSWKKIVKNPSFYHDFCQLVKKISKKSIIVQASVSLFCQLNTQK